MNPQRPLIARIARGLEWGAVLFTVALLVFVATLPFSAARVGFAGSPVHGVAPVGGSTVDLTLSFPLKDQGAYPLDGLSVHLWVRDPDGALITQGLSPPVTIPSGGVSSIHLALPFSFANVSALSFLLVNDTVLSGSLSGNATYAYFFPVQVQVENLTFPWGAPFSHLAATVGAPQVAPNGSAVVPFTLSFQDNATFPVVGTLSFRLLAPSGTPCGSSDLSLDVIPGQSDRSTTQVPVSSGCDPLGGTFTGTFSSYTLDFPLPPQRIPA